RLYWILYELCQSLQMHTKTNYSALNFFLKKGKVKGSILGNHYKVEAFLGEGGFGIVAKCRDTMTNRAVAIKVNKSDPDILQQAKLEIFILEQLRRLDPDAANIVKWNGFFHDGEWVCLKFELLDQCLWDYIGDRKNQGLPISEVRPILGHLTNALSHLGSVGIVRADLKPGNIMVVNRYESPVKVRLIDFGLACPASAVMPGDRVGTVGYSAPEVMLGLPYNEASDMWSLGLVAVELGTGVPLYPGNEDYDVLKFIIETQGQPPDHTRYIKLTRLDDLEQVMMFRRGPENGQRLFVSLIKQILASDANQRITLLEVLRHPFFNPKSSPCIGMSAERPQNPVVFQHPSHLKCKRSEKINSHCNTQSSLSSLAVSDGFKERIIVNIPTHFSPASRQPVDTQATITELDPKDIYIYIYI
uniref:Protein kinase domain-containing protein n=1 Tax=Maylandia zebra TaxID=106582 RepID=A0A3P9BAE3_9CICH